ncbi:hypothetical protein I552_1082 [Mycobacterium xenopi 3993]|nr:hypothetical protein I552_1082 [Mycobacterium xenopi 3993]
MDSSSRSNASIIDDLPISLGRTPQPRRCREFDLAVSDTAVVGQD